MKIIPSPPRAPLSFQSPCMSLDHHSSLMPAAKSKPVHSPLPTVAKQGQRQMVSTAFTGWAASTVIPHWSTSLPAWSPSAHPSPKPLAAVKGRTCLALHAHFLQAKPPFFFFPLLPSAFTGLCSLCLFHLLSEGWAFRHSPCVPKAPW